MATQPRPSLRDACVVALVKRLHIVPLTEFVAVPLAEDVLLALLAVRSARACDARAAVDRRD